MAQKLFFGSIWLAFTIYAIASSFHLAATPEEDFDLIVQMSTGQISGINPLVVAIFYIMGIFPWVYAAFILFDGTEQKVSPYPFFFVSVGLGAFALLPYLALRQPNTTIGQKNLLQKFVDSRLTAIISAIAIVVLLTWGITQGNWSDFITQWQTTQFIHVMSLDFCCLCLLFPAVLGNDLKRRGVSGVLRQIALIPLFGALIYWCLRPQLPETVISPSNASQISRT